MTVDSVSHFTCGRTDRDSPLHYWTAGPLKVGDELTVQVVESARCDEPVECREPSTREHMDELRVSYREGLKSGRRKPPTDIVDARQYPGHFERDASERVICFDVSVNGKPTVRAGAGRLGSLDISIWWPGNDESCLGRNSGAREWPGGRSDVTVWPCGCVYDLETDEGWRGTTFLDWGQRIIGVGDRVILRVTEATDHDPPQSTHRMTASCLRDSWQRYVEQVLAEEETGGTQ
ncbi:MAG: hypothetical protein GHCLOJNM_02945 [bacterium]|nr:hypothetical protein [bacterium]